jgi:hypothetical protein
LKWSEKPAASAQLGISTPCHFCAEAGTFRGLNDGAGQQRYFTRASQVFEEALALPDPPDGFVELMLLVTAGDLRLSRALFVAMDSFWDGTVIWVRRRGDKILSRPNEKLAEFE